MVTWETDTDGACGARTLRDVTLFPLLLLDNG